MKQLVVMALAVLLAGGCNDTSNPDAKKTDSTSSSTAAAPAESYDYPYTLSRPYQNWQPGDQQHVVNVMKSLKAFETGDINTAVAAFGDTVDLRFDYLQARVSNDSLKKMFTESRSKLASLKVVMQDWEPVISKDKKLEYVTLWYKEITTDNKGKTDSLAIIDDLKIANGKIVELDQKIQHFPRAKKM